MSINNNTRFINQCISEYNFKWTLIMWNSSILRDLKDVERKKSECEIQLAIGFELKPFGVQMFVPRFGPGEAI